MDWFELLKNEEIETFNQNRPDKLDLFGVDLSGVNLEAYECA